MKKITDDEAIIQAIAQDHIRSLKKTVACEAAVQALANQLEDARVKAEDARNEADKALGRLKAKIRDEKFEPVITGPAL